MIPDRHTGLQLLHEELQCWQSSNQICTFWWRDDDLIAHTPRFEQLERISKQHDVIPLVAVIPQIADASLGREMPKSSSLTFCQHGLSHTNHEPEGQWPSEFGASRSLDEIERDIRLGAQIMGEIFGERFMPVFVPPWNTLIDDALPLLPGAGLRGLSQYGACQQHESLQVRRINTHLDIIDWGIRPDPKPLPIESLSRKAAEVLRLRREENADSVEPFGLLTHHRVMDQDAWNFVELFINVTREFNCAKWLPPTDIFIDAPTVRLIG